MSRENLLQRRAVHWLGMAGLGRNIGYGANKVFTAPMLESLKASQPLIGFILGLEGLIGLLMNPLMGWLSDHTTKPGFRRKIYVGICLPGAALAWLLFYFLHSQIPAMLLIVIFYLFQQSSVSPYQAWMPEIVPPTKWGVASGILNLWWLAGNLIAFLVVPMVWTVNHVASFVLTSALMVFGGLATVLGVPEPVVAPLHYRTNKISYKALLQRDLVLFFIVHFLSWLSYEALASFFTMFMVHVVKGSQMDAAFAMALFTATGIVAAFLVGRVYRKMSPKILLSISLLCYGVLSLAGLVVHSLTDVFMVVGIEGVFWSMNLTVSFALASDLLHQIVHNEQLEERLRGGLYGVTTIMESAGLMIAAPLSGVVISWSGSYSGVFLVSASSSIVSIVFVLGIRLMKPSDITVEGNMDQSIRKNL
ncbi:MFS transporter [Alicyclobacillus fastidiosus]|uniref:MFS transporter n=1 Tax=Alicyclobacillus fastidiosus TaxID=392011 RepID=A0ABV5AD41_9BACL|nr:MFS transporter [Alicyclobacillus fastidiosus]WEH08846.1 MFS transporter [Alicyclobacillus fastidiosus]